MAPVMGQQLESLSVKAGLLNVPQRKSHHHLCRFTVDHVVG